MSCAPVTQSLSVVLATCNRAPVLHHTLSRLEHCLSQELGPNHGEILVVSNPACAGQPTAADAAIVARHPLARLISLRRNRGSCAKAWGVRQARGDLLLFLDDDS